MEIRQIFMVILFMVAAAIMKNAMPEEVHVAKPAKVSAADRVEVGDQAVSSPMVTALAPTADLLSLSLPKQTSQSSTVVASGSLLHNSDFEAVPIPGSLIALVVSALSLVSVARRSL